MAENPLDRRDRLDGFSAPFDPIKTVKQIKPLNSRGEQVVRQATQFGKDLYDVSGAIAHPFVEAGRAFVNTGGSPVGLARGFAKGGGEGWNTIKDIAGRKWEGTKAMVNEQAQRAQDTIQAVDTNTPVEIIRAERLANQTPSSQRGLNAPLASADQALMDLKPNYVGDTKFSKMGLANGMTRYQDGQGNFLEGKAAKEPGTMSTMDFSGLRDLAANYDKRNAPLSAQEQYQRALGNYERKLARGGNIFGIGAARRKAEGLKDFATQEQKGQMDSASELARANLKGQYDVMLEGLKRQPTTKELVDMGSTQQADAFTAASKYFPDDPQKQASMMSDVQSLGLSGRPEDFKLVGDIYEGFSGLKSAINTDEPWIQDLLNPTGDAADAYEGAGIRERSRLLQDLMTGLSGKEDTMMIGNNPVDLKRLREDEPKFVNKLRGMSETGLFAKLNQEQ